MELPSQLYEHWLMRPEVLKRFARHYKTGKPAPAALLERFEAARNFNQGFKTIEYLAAAIVDLDLHALETSKALDVDRFEAADAAAHRHARGDRDAPPHSAFSAHYGRLRGRLLQLPVVRGDGRRRLPGLRGDRRHLRPRRSPSASTTTSTPPAANATPPPPTKPSAGGCRRPMRCWRSGGWSRLLRSETRPHPFGWARELD